MAFGKVDHVENHITGERKQITSIDVDKEYGMQGHATYKGSQEESEARLQWLEDYRQECINTILSIENIPSTMLKEPFDSYLSLDKVNNRYIWNTSTIKSLSGDMLYNIHILATKRIDNDGTAFYMNSKGSFTDYQGNSYIPRHINL